MKKICFITTIPLTLQAFVLTTAEYLHENTDYEITFICDYDKDFENSLPDYIRYIPVTMKRGISPSGVKAVLEMAKIFKREKFDMIQYSTPNASFYAAIAGKLAKIKVRLYCQWGIAYVGVEGIKRWIFKVIEKTVCRLSTWIEPDSFGNLAFSHREKLYPKEKGSVIGRGSACGVNLEKFDYSKKDGLRSEIRNKYSIPETAFVFGYVGRITRDKGVNELLKAYKYLHSQYSDTYLLMVGPEECDGTVDESLFVWSKECSRVIYSGFTNEVEKYLSAMDTYLLPSYREGFGMGVVEAEAMGVPAIVTNIPGPTDAVLDGKTGLIVEKKNVNDLFAAMEKLMTDKDLRNSCSECARVYVSENFEQKTFLVEVLKDRKKLLS